MVCRWYWYCQLEGSHDGSAKYSSICHQRTDSVAETLPDVEHTFHIVTRRYHPFDSQKDNNG
jgi:hypothetical protein